MNRILKVVRMQLTNRQTFIWVPLIVLGGAFALNLAVYGILISAGATGNLYSGAAQAPLWYFAVIGAQALTMTFPFSQAMSVTRREFFLGTMLTAVLTAAMLAVIFVIGGLIETATGGWGFNGYFFAVGVVWESGSVLAGLFYFVLAMLFFVSGFWGATIFKRFGTLWLVVTLVGIAAVIVLALFAVTRMDAWSYVADWFASIGFGGITLLTAAVAAVLAAIAFPTLRRATP
ncbi:hypothetical protein [Microbacterium sp. CIAB417]|uniref:hypothetical protein n=1 Tax=Microbacterium sp. CIAB417 TaxID=2860287 RepID=UPI001FACCA17|nr:hypothetical protein [Microbacterium sp. CIAB417]